MDSAQQIILDACQIAKAPGFITQAGRFFSYTLRDLCYHRKLKENMKSTQITFAAGSNGPFLLPSDYQRPYDLWYQVDGFPYMMNMITLLQYDELFKDQSVANYPRLYATDLSTTADNPSTPGRLYVYPQSTSEQVATLRYFVLRDDIENPESSDTVPWFDDTEYLRMDVARQLMAITDDDRLPKFEDTCEKLLRKHLVIDGDEQIVAQKVQLDPTRFFTGRNLPPTKKTGW